MLIAVLQELESETYETYENDINRRYRILT